MIIFVIHSVFYLHVIFVIEKYIFFNFESIKSFQIILIRNPLTNMFPF